MGLPAAPRGQCSGAQLGSTPAGHTVPEGPRQGRPRPSSPSTRPAGAASRGAHSPCIGRRGLVSLGAWVLQKALPPGTRNCSGPCCQLTAVPTGFPAHLISKSQEEAPLTELLPVLCTHLCALSGGSALSCSPRSTRLLSTLYPEAQCGNQPGSPGDDMALLGVDQARAPRPAPWPPHRPAEAGEAGVGRGLGAPRCSRLPSLPPSCRRPPHCRRQGWEREGEGRG